MERRHCSAISGTSRSSRALLGKSLVLSLECIMHSAWDAVLQRPGPGDRDPFRRRLVPSPTQFLRQHACKTDARISVPLSFLASSLDWWWVWSIMTGARQCWETDMPGQNISANIHRFRLAFSLALQCCNVDCGTTGRNDLFPCATACPPTLKGRQWQRPSSDCKMCLI